MAERKKKTFESSLARLEEIVRAMESGDAMLDESLALYEEGVKLVKFCTKTLDAAEQKVMRPDGVYLHVQGRRSRIDWLNVCVSRQ